MEFILILMAPTIPSLPLPPLGQLVSDATEHSLIFMGGQMSWLDLGVWLLSICIVYLSYRNHRRLMPPRRRWLMVGLRTLLVGILILVYYQPAILSEYVQKHENAVVVLNDVSESMTLPHQGGTRSEAFAEWRSKNEAALRAGKNFQKILHFDFAQALFDPETGPLEMRRATDITATLSELRDRLKHQSLAGIVLLTDGIDTTSARQKTTLTPELSSVLKDLEAPISAITLDNPDTIKDIAITRVALSNFSLLLNRSSLDATITVNGYPNEQLNVRLLENGREIASQILDVQEDETYYKLGFDFVPKQAGKQVYTVQITPKPDEIYAKNNSRSAITNVVRDKIRVVQVAGQPSWDVRHMRQLLKENPNVDLVSFFILALRSNARPVSPDETALIPFPVDELFGQELGGFDLLVMQNFNYGPYNMRQYLPYIANFVRDGGALVITGGPLSFTPGGYYGTELADILPFTIPPSFDSAASLNQEIFQAQLTDIGRFHPITRLALDPQENETTWKNMPPLEGLNLASQLRKDAVVLLDHPNLKEQQGQAQPVVAIREVGEGRVMSISTDSTWFWNFKATKQAQDPKNYTHFWNQAIRWLIKDPELDLLKVHSLKNIVSVGQEAQFLISAFQVDYRPLQNHPLKVVLRRFQPESDRLVQEGELVTELPDLKTNQKGELRLSIPIQQDGNYEIEVSSQIAGTRLSKAKDIFIAEDINPEFEHLIPDRGMLSLLAQETGGKILSIKAAFADIPLEDPTIVHIKSQSKKELWNAPWALVLAAALFALEWWLRRRYGYI